MTIYARARTTRQIERLAGALGGGALLALVLWAAAPLVYLLLRAAAHHESLSGGDSLFGADQLQYLSWIRSSGEHVLASNGFALRLGGQVFLQPMFVISGLLWHAGMNIALSYLLWLPVAVAALYVGFRKFIFRMISSPLGRSVALILALFFVTPADPAVGWTVGSSGLGTLAGQLAPTGTLYGYFPVAIAIGLMALFMLGVHSIIHPSGRRRPTSWYLGWTAAAGLAAAWLHPWQGETALLVIAAILVLGRFGPTVRPLLIPAAAVVLPLAYYFLLSRIDGAWRLAQLQSAPPRPSILLLLAALAPLLVPATAALRAGGRRDAIMWLWPASALVVYFVSPGYAPHALEGVVLPLTVLAVRGWQALRWPAWTAALAVGLSTLPGLAFNLHLFRDTALSDPQAMLLRGDESRALAYLARAPTPGGVLPSVRLAPAIPAYTGRRTWFGHASWSPGYGSRVAVASALFDGGVSGTAGRDLLRQVGARYLLADCEPGFHPSLLGRLLIGERRFGCVDVYELNVPNRALPL
jgi:hypothetical protein